MGAAAAAALAAASALARPAAPGARPGAAAATRIRASAAFGTGAILDESDLSAVHFCAIELLQSPLHVRVEPELYHPLVPPTFVSVSVGNLTCLPHVVLQVLPTAAAGEILNNEPIISPDRRTVSVSSPASISTF